MSQSSNLLNPDASLDADSIIEALASQDYVADKSLATVMLLSLKMGRPLFLEGDAGVGKTELAKVIAAATGRDLIRLQCYEGLEVSQAVYEWNYAAQMLAIRVAEADGSVEQDDLKRDLFGSDFLIERPILQAIRSSSNPQGAVLLIDELDRADEAFEAYLLEVLSDFQVTIPEIGTLEADIRPLVVITTNRTREIHDALKRRCLYHWMDYPDLAREVEIIERKHPGIDKSLSQQVAAFVQHLRQMPLFKLPGVAETLDWAEALMILDQVELNPEVVADTMGVLLKYQDDLEKMASSDIARMLDDVRSTLQAAE